MGTVKCYKEGSHTHLLSPLENVYGFFFFFSPLWAIFLAISILPGGRHLIFPFFSDPTLQVVILSTSLRGKWLVPQF